MKTKFLILLATLAVLTLQNPYIALGLEDGASQDKVISKFKRAALKYHPAKLDYEFGDNDAEVQKLQKEFLKIASAYSEIRYGHKLNTETLVGDYDQFYNSFFGKQQVCGMTSDNTPQCEQYSIGEGYTLEPTFKGTNTTDLDFSNIGQFLDRKEQWLVILYKDNTVLEKDEKLKKLWSKLGNSNRDLYKIGAVDCKIEKEICSVVFEIDNISSSEGWGYRVRGEKKTMGGFVQSLKNFGSLAMEFLKDYEIDELYEPNYNRIMNGADKAGKKVAILFTEKNTSPRVWKVMSQYFEPYMTFLTASSVNTKMIEKFGVKRYPSVAVLEDPTNISSTVFYPGDKFDKLEVIKFLKQYRKPLTSEFQELTQSMLESGQYCTKEDNKFCLIFNLQNDQSLLEKVRNVPEDFKKKPIRFLYINEGFQEELQGKPGYLVIKSKRSRYIVKEYEGTNLDELVNGALDGTIDYSVMPQTTLQSIKF